jgi:alpha-glucoside transport system substrate-binding protein
VVVAAACAPSTGSGGGTVRVLAVWEGTELDALLAVLAPFEERTGIEVLYSSTRDLRGVLGAELADGNPPDVAGLEGPGHMRELAEAGALRDLETAIDIQAYKADVAPTFIELGTVDGRLVGAFVKSTVKGLVWYAPDAFRRGTPLSFDDLRRMAQLEVADGGREWCVGLESAESSGWPGTDWVELFLVRQSGLDVYDRWVAGELPWTSPEVRRAFESYGQIVAEDAVFGGAEGALETRFDDAGAPLFTQPPGCVFMLQGSFMPVFFESAGLEPGTDFDFFPFPEVDPASGGAVLGAGDLMGLLSSYPAAADMMDYLLSAEAQEIWVAQGGALSVNQRVDTYPNDLVAREAAVLSGAEHFRFDGSDLMPAAMNQAFWEGILDFTADQSRLPEILERLDAVRETAYAR